MELSTADLKYSYSRLNNISLNVRKIFTPLVRNPLGLFFLLSTRYTRYLLQGRIARRR